MGKRKTGPRTKGGRLKNRTPQRVDPPAYIMDRLHTFAPFQDGKAGPHLESLIGRAWAVGLLENDRVDPAALRDAGQRYAAAYWGNYPYSAAVANYEGLTRRGSGLGADGADPRGEAFEAMDRRLRDAGSAACQAVHELAVDPIALTEHRWIVGLINRALILRRRDVAGPILSQVEERLAVARMADAVSGLLALAEGVAMRRAA